MKAPLHAYRLLIWDDRCKRPTARTDPPDSTQHRTGVVVFDGDSGLVRTLRRWGAR
jgi:hypothetical protein